MRFFSSLALFTLPLLALAAPSTPSSSDSITNSSDSDLESRTFYCPAGTNWKITKCCPHDAYERHFQCVCATPGKTLSANGRSCEQKCSQSGWKWCTTQCCPPGSDEVHGQCKVCQFSLPSVNYIKLTTNQCSGGKQLVGSGSNKKCVDQCPRGHYFAKTKCCPSSSTEQWDKSCKCDNSHQKLSQDGSKCIDKCPAGWNACATKCCPPGSSEKNGQCVVSRLVLFVIG